MTRRRRFVSCLAAFSAMFFLVVALIPARCVAATFVSDTYMGNENGRLHYAGHWEHVRDARDGRLFGTSSRTFASGASVELTFIGRTIRVYGVRGPGGGAAMLFLDGKRLARLDFYATAKIVRAVMYSSPILPLGPHTVRVVVIGVAQGARHKAGYVNLSGMAYQ